MAGDARESILNLPLSRRRTGSVAQRLDQLNLPVMYFLGSLLAIGVISAYDAYLVKHVRPVILSFERNPVCAMLIHWDPHQLSYFFLAKALGTVLVLGILIGLFCWKRSLALPVITGVMGFQVGLLAYLNLAPG